MSGVFPKEIFGHWIQDEEEKEKPEDQPSKSQVDLRNLLNEPGALKELVNFFKTANLKDGEKEVQSKRKRFHKNKRN
jgi:hypothetical protein